MQLVRATRPPRPVTRPDQAAARPVAGLRRGRSQGCDTVGARPRHGPTHGMRTGLSALCAPCAQPGSAMCAHCALDLVLDSVHCLGHCS